MKSKDKHHKNLKIILEALPPKQIIKIYLSAQVSQMVECKNYFFNFFKVELSRYEMGKNGTK